MTRQVNFYLDNKDLEKMEIYLQNLDFQMFNFPIRKAEKVQLKADSHLSNTRYLVRSADIEYVLANPKTLPIHLPLIEYTVTHCESGNYWIRGRLFYYASRNDNGKWLPQNDMFLRLAERFFRWFRYHFQLQTASPFLGNYGSKNLVELKNA